MPSRPSLSLGWLVFFLWPVPLFVILFLVRALLEEASFWVIAAAITVASAIAVAAEAIVHFNKWLASPGPEYSCPFCGHDILHTPHRCPSCGSRLIWGHVPGPRDRHCHCLCASEHRSPFAV
jgi:hypothetical protein